MHAETQPCIGCGTSPVFNVTIQSGTKLHLNAAKNVFDGIRRQQIAHPGLPGLREIDEGVQQRVNQLGDVPGFYRSQRRRIVFKPGWTAREPEYKPFRRYCRKPHIVRMFEHREALAAVDHQRKFRR